MQLYTMPEACAELDNFVGGTDAPYYIVDDFRVFMCSQQYGIERKTGLMMALPAYLTLPKVESIAQNDISEINLSLSNYPDSCSACRCKKSCFILGAPEPQSPRAAL